ncbi:hypothetical protein AJ80_08062 [Polytolypa hystricis UAMH7299]|uniref:Uncharacterized protein n=1 Tax=Polytolypa hystricis (strain UAMH7299) TaxID=1447883 RepID=A0A2B7XDQ5_POLH7|nr:hypothetical protein AJ80_08062 [Polytolypa hystricis UAMH7299]
MDRGVKILSQSPVWKKKIVVSGHDGAGKTELRSALLKLIKDRYGGEECISVDEDAYQVSLRITWKEGETAKKIDIWEDTENSYSRLKPLIYPYANIVLICLPLDLVRQDPEAGFEIALNRIETARHFTKDDDTYTSLFLVGCRSDLLLQQQSEPARDGGTSVSFIKRYDVRKEARRFTARHWLDGYLECSAVTGEGVSDVFDIILKDLVDQKRRNLHSQKTSCIIT